MSEKGPAIGIDFGTSTCSVAVYHQGKVEVIPNDVGRTTTPSCVSFTSNGRLIGEASKKLIRDKPANHDIYDVKRLIGRRFDDAHVQNDMKLWPFSVINHQSKPMIKVDCEGEKKTFFPEEMASILFLQMKEAAEAYLGKKVTQAVISVPANFNDSQRRAVKDAGTIAGLDVIRIINEPSAAAIAYGFQNKNETKRNIIIFDLGGGTCDVSVIKVENGSFTVKSTRGDTHLGGIEFDNRMVDHFVKEFQKKHKKDISNNKSALCRLKIACEEAKILLSSSMEAPIEIDSLKDDIHFKSSISRSLFEELNDDLFFSTLELIQSAIRDAGLEESEIDDLILSGGSTRIPKIQQMLRDFLPEISINECMDPDEAVACGAALMAAILQGDKSDSLKDLAVFDVAPQSLGVHILGGMMRTIVKRNTVIPVSKTASFSTLRDSQKSLIFPIGEGECVKVDGNRLLGKISLNGTHPAPGVDHQIEIHFRIDANGCLNVFTYQGEVKIESEITFDDARLERRDFERLEEYEKELKLAIEKRESVKARDALQSYCEAVGSKFEEGNRKCQEILLIMKRNGNAPTLSKDYVEHKKKQLDQIVDEIRLIQESSNEQNGGNSSKRQRTE